MTRNELTSDGIANFGGGMDTFSSPYLLGSNQYSYSVNCKLVPGKGGIMTRSGYRCIKINFLNEKDKDFFAVGRIQGCGYFTIRGIIKLLVGCSGRVFELTRVTNYSFNARVVPASSDENIPTFYFTGIPYRSIIINDGFSAPVSGDESGYRRLTGRNAIRPGRAGAFIQGRFYYITENEKEIEFSSLNIPETRTEAMLANILNFYCQDSTKYIALGEQKAIGNDSDGGSLIASTQSNIYTFNVRGKMSDWGNPQTKEGKAVGSLFDVSACSPFSMVSMNGNAYFRSQKMGLASLQYLQYIWNNVDIIEPQSYGAHLFFDSDEPRFLDQCYSVRNKSSVYTTVGPAFDGNSVYWNGIMCATPGQKGVIRYDSLHTGIRPWCMVNVEGPNQKEELFIFSKDHDGINRLYMMDDDIDYDVNEKSERVEIESQFCSRLYNFDNPLLYKTISANRIQITPMSNSVKLCLSTRFSENDSFGKPTPFFMSSHLMNYDRASPPQTGLVFVNDNRSTGSRDLVVPTSGSNDSVHFNEFQMLAKVTGSFHLSRHVMTAKMVLPEAISAQEKQSFPKKIIEQNDLYSHRIH